MILQRDAKINIWGWASKDEKISIKFNGKNLKQQRYRWQMDIAITAYESRRALHHGDPASNKIVFHDILIGDVWFCSGQSNMEHQMKLHGVNYANEIANANYAQIRHFWIPTMTDLKDHTMIFNRAHWKSANPEDVLEFSAVAYFFAKNIYEKYHVPIGLINASVGGTPIEAWTSEEGLKEFPNISQLFKKIKTRLM